MTGIKVAFAIAIAGAGIGLLIGVFNLNGGKWKLSAAEKPKDVHVAV